MYKLKKLGAASLLLTLCYSPAFSQDSVEPWEIELGLSRSTASERSTWTQQSLEVRHNDVMNGLMILGKLEHYERFGLSDTSAALGFVKTLPDKSFTRLELSLAPNVNFRPQTSLDAEIGWVAKDAFGTKDTFVWSLQGRHAQYQSTQVSSVGVGYEYYPKSIKGWLSGRINQSWAEGDNLGPSALIRADYQVNKTFRVYGLVARGFEPEGTNIVDVRGSALGIVMALGAVVDVNLTIGREERDIGPARSDTTLSIVRRF